MKELLGVAMYVAFLWLLFSMGASLADHHDDQERAKPKYTLHVVGSSGGTPSYQERLRRWMRENPDVEIVSISANHGVHYIIVK